MAKLGLGPSSVSLQSLGFLPLSLPGMAGFCRWDVLPQEREDWVLVHPPMPVGGTEQSLLPGGVMGQHTDAGVFTALLGSRDREG